MEWFNLHMIFNSNIFKIRKIFAGQINGTSNNIGSGIIGGKDYVGMSKDSGISFDIGKLPAGHRKILKYVYILMKIKNYA